ncbi:MAG: molecular chaperone HtpG [Thermodesulfovibrionales bacterium]|nr:molecular chaperone HtpG [Thermodesulfovibrionales bacterium]
MSIQSHEFKTEVKQLLDLMIHSLYSHKEVFLRELISNASDAIDKVRFLGLTNQTLYEANTDWKIKISVDAENSILTVSDNGIGMSKDEIVEALGTIAHSGTREFLEQLQSKENLQKADLIGQFGVGFYSSFMVADKITVISRKAGLPNDMAVKWESTGDGRFTVEDTKRDGRGTDVILHIKEDEKRYLQEWEIKAIVKKYSDFIEHPIYLEVEREKQSELDKTKTVKVKEEEKINSQKALWLRDKSEITKEEYDEFYKHISHDFNPPQKVIHYKAEGTQEFTVLLFIPSKMPFNLYFKDYKIGPMLYIKRVQIMKNCEDLLPEYLRFVKGVVDADDLPLNVSREMLQNNRQVEIIRKNITKKVLDTLSEMMQNEYDEYVKFYREFGKILKEAIHFDFSKRDTVGDLLLFESINSAEGNLIRLKDYVDNMQEGQDAIYYITAQNYKDAVNSPYIEIFKKKGIDVLVLTDPIDDIIFTDYEYNGKRFKAVMKGELDITRSDDKTDSKKDFEPLLKFIKDVLDNKVKDVRLSGRLTDSPCCLVYDEGAVDQRIEMIMKAMGQTVQEQKKILEINPSHPLFMTMNERFEKGINRDELTKFVKLLYDHALILDGSRPENPSDTIKTLSEILIQSLKT